MKEAKTPLSKTLLIITIFISLSYLIPRCLSDNYTQSYQLLNHPDGSTYYNLNVAISQSLYDYYAGKTHSLSSDSDFAKFVTPYSLEPIADNLWQIYTDDEDFANGALMIVHQIPYEATTPPKYPVETIADNKGDCDLFSFITASVLEAGGLDTVLLYYENEAHMNIGVSLSHEPYDARGSVYSVTYNNVAYYVAECTGGSWQTGWRVGECPDDLQQALETVQIITLENSEQWAPGQVSASYKTLATSTISLTISPTLVIQGGTITLSGQLSPALGNRTIVIYVKTNSSPWKALGTTTTDSAGHFTYAWNEETSGVCYIRASWSGDNDYAGADSPALTVTILSMFFILLLVAAIVLICVGIVIYVITRKAQPELPEPQPPPTPY